MSEDLQDADGEDRDVRIEIATGAPTDDNPRRDRPALLRLRTGESVTLPDVSVRYLAMADVVGELLGGRIDPKDVVSIHPVADDTQRGIS